jgi:hypothetical protein
MKRLIFRIAAAFAALLLMGSTPSVASNGRIKIAGSAPAAAAGQFTCRTNDLIIPVRGGIPSAGDIKVRKCWASDGQGTYRVRWFAWFFPDSGRRIGLEARVDRSGSITRHLSAPAEGRARRSPPKGFHQLNRVSAIHFKACEINAEGKFFNCTTLW